MTGSFGPTMDRRTLLKLGGTGLALTGVGALSACSATSAGAGTSSKNASATLKMLYFGQQSAATTLQKALEPQIKKIDKNATLEITGINGTDWNDFIAKVLTQIAAGAAPDLVSVATEGLQEMASKQMIVPLDSYVTKDMSSLKSYFDDVHPALVESMMYQGHLYELTDSFNAGSMFYSSSLYSKAGLSAPSASWTMDDFHNNAQKLAALGSNTNAFDWVVRLWGSWTSFLYANNG